MFAAINRRRTRKYSSRSPLYFSRIFPFLVVFEFWFRDYGVKGGSVLELVSVRKFPNINDLAGRKFFDEIGPARST